MRVGLLGKGIASGPDLGRMLARAFPRATVEAVIGAADAYR